MLLHDTSVWREHLTACYGEKAGVRTAAGHDFPLVVSTGSRCFGTGLVDISVAHMVRAICWWRCKGLANFMAFSAYVAPG